MGQGSLTEFDAVSVDTGRFTGRSPKDKYVVVDEQQSQCLVEAQGLTTPLDQRTWESLKEIASTQLNGKELYVVTF